MSASQSSNVYGNYNIVVQGRGDGITVNINEPHLSLIAWHRQQNRPEKVLDLLNPFVRAIPLVGREFAQADLESWLDSNQSISVRCLIGEGGSGKTRLAIELCESAERRNWFCGFVNYKELDRFAKQQNLSSWGWSKNTLVVVDYAAARARVLREWLLELARNFPTTDRNLRLLLLERHADTALGWWHDIVTPGTFSEEPLRTLFNPVSPISLPSIATADQRREILSYVMSESSRLLGSAQVLKPPAAGEDSAFDSKLADPSVAFAPLYLTMSGVAAVQEGITTLLTRGRADMAQRIATDELSRIEKLANDREVNAELLKYLVAGLTLIGGYSRDDFFACIAEERSALGYGQQDDIRLAEAAYDVLGAQLDRVPPILPDLIGEAAVLEQLSKLPKSVQDQFVARWFARVHGSVIATLVRTAQDYTQTDDPLRWFDSVVDGNQIPARLQEISDQLPKETLVFRDRSTKISELIVKKLREERSDDSNRQRLASAVHTLATRLAAIGRWEEALEMTQESLGLRREIAEAQPDASRPDSASSLYLLAIILSSLGQREEALVPAQEAAQLYRELAEAQPDTFRPGLAMSLNCMAATLSTTGKWEHALLAAQEVVELYRELAAAGQPESVRAELASALTNLATILKNLGRRDEALVLAQEAVEVYRELAAAQPDAFRPQFAESLNNLANRLTDLGRKEESLTIALRAVEIYRELAATYPNAFRPRLALLTSNLASSLGDLGQRWEALKTAQEAVKVSRDLMSAQPDAFRPLLAMSLDNLANRLGDLQQRELALGPAEEATELRRQLVEAEPDAFKPDLALSFNNLGVRLSELGRGEQALERTKQAVELYRELSAIRPNAFRPDLARSLHRLAICNWQQSMFDEAAQSDEEALAILGPIFLCTPAPFAQLMRAITFNYQQRLRLLNREKPPNVSELLRQILAVLNPETQPDSAA